MQCTKETEGQLYGSAMASMVQELLEHMERECKAAAMREPKIDLDEPSTKRVKVDENPEERQKNIDSSLEVKERCAYAHCNSKLEMDYSFGPCSECSLVKYCRTDAFPCKAKDWENHKDLCQSFQEAYRKAVALNQEQIHELTLEKVLDLFKEFDIQNIPVHVSDSEGRIGVIP